MTKRKLLSLSLAALCFSCSQKKIDTVVLKNPSDFLRQDEAGVISRSELGKHEENLVPVLKNQKGEYIASQIDDLDGDGTWDELSYVYDIDANEELILKIEWIDKDQYPTFKQRTNAHFGKMFAPGDIREVTTESHGKENLARGGDPEHPYPYQTDGPCWENDKMGFRQYFDGRNCRDVYGKRVSYMVLDTIGIREDGTPGDTYHVLKDWGRDIMSAANSFGLGGIAVQLPDTLLRLGVSIDTNIDNVDSTFYTFVCRGPVRSIIRLDYKGWQVGDTKVDVHEKITIWPGKYGYENEVTTSPLPEGATLVSGIVANFNDMPERLQMYDNKFVSMSTHDKQTYNKEWYMGMSLIIPSENYIDTFDAPQCNSDIMKTWCVRLKPDSKGIYRYNAYDAWELTDQRFTSRDFYMQMIDSYANNMCNPIQVTLK